MKSVTIVLVLALALVSYPTFSQSLQSPSQQSAIIMKAVIGSVTSNNFLSMFSIKQISLENDKAKIHLYNSDNDCFSITYIIIANHFGEIEIKDSPNRLMESCN